MHHMITAGSIFQRLMMDFPTVCFGRAFFQYHKLSSFTKKPWRVSFVATFLIYSCSLWLWMRKKISHMMVCLLQEEDHYLVAPYNPRIIIWQNTLTWSKICSKSCKLWNYQNCWYNRLPQHHTGLIIKLWHWLQCSARISPSFQDD